MPKDPFGISDMPSLGDIDPFSTGSKKKRVKLNPKERLYVWEHPEKYGRICSICHKRIMKPSDMELDHTKPYCKGGTKLALAHRDCNSMKGSRALKDVQVKMGFPTTVKEGSKPKRKPKRKTKKKKSTIIFDIPTVKLPKTPF